jgi:predicted ATP-dependent endonuclease of OLD family
MNATHCDLFFADGVIFVEGQAERDLVSTSSAIFPELRDDM